MRAARITTSSSWPTRPAISAIISFIARRTPSWSWARRASFRRRGMSPIRPGAPSNCRTGFSSWPDGGWTRSITRPGWRRGRSATRRRTSRTPIPRRSRAYLLNPDFTLAVFKGAAASFRPWDRQLRQYILLAQPKSIVGVAPLPGFLHQSSLLDTLGVDRAGNDLSLELGARARGEADAARQDLRFVGSGGRYAPQRRPPPPIRST